MTRRMPRQRDGVGTRARRALTLLLYPPIAMLAILALIGAWFLLAPLLRSPAEGGVTTNPASVSSAGATFSVERVTRLTDGGVADMMAALSADGRYVVHVKRENNLPSIWVRQTATTSDVQIVPPADAYIAGLTFSPDGNYVYYVTKPSAGPGSDL